MYTQLTREQRYAIYLGKQEGKTQTAIARQIGVHKSTVSSYKRNRYVGPLSSFDKGMGFTLRCVKDLE